MSRNVLIRGLPLAALACLLLAGCASSELYKAHMDNGYHFFRHGKFQEAMLSYGRALKLKKSFEAYVGFGNAAMEYGNDIFTKAHGMVAVNTKKALEMVTDANSRHDDAFKALHIAARKRSSDPRPHYYLGLLHYLRVPNKLIYPPVAPKAGDEREEPILRSWVAHIDKNYREEIDRGITSFRKVLTMNASAALKVYSHRYLGNLLLLRGTLHLDAAMREKDEFEAKKRYKLAKDDLSASREELQAFHKGAWAVIDRAIEISRQGMRSPEDREWFQKHLDRMVKQLREVVDTLTEYRNDLRREVERLSQKPALTVNEVEWKKWLESEADATEPYIEMFHKRLNEAETVPRPPPSRN
ncbi:MAG: hypothetical protein ACYTAF_09905 [Planctomycetota bacterium]|jgi:tetratricopeptide (TPR) repeat protein